MAAQCRDCGLFLDAWGVCPIVPASEAVRGAKTCGGATLRDIGTEMERATILSDNPILRYGHLAAECDLKLTNPRLLDHERITIQLEKREFQRLQFEELDRLLGEA